MVNSAVRILNFCAYIVISISILSVVMCLENTIQYDNDIRSLTEYQKKIIEEHSDQQSSKLDENLSIPYFCIVDYCHFIKKRLDVYGKLCSNCIFPNIIKIFHVIFSCLLHMIKIIDYFIEESIGIRLFTVGWI